MTNMSNVLPQNQRYLRDVFGTPLNEGSCVVDNDGQVGYVRLDLGPQCAGPSSAYWDGWFNVTATRSENPLRGKAMRGDLVQLLSGARS